MLINFLLFTIVFFSFGFLPLYLVFHLIKSIEAKAKIIFSLGFAPVLISIFNIINIYLNIKHGFSIYIIPIIVDVALIIYVIRRGHIRLNEFAPLNDDLTKVLIGFVFGLSYWTFSFYNYYRQGVLLPDIVFNLGFVSEMKLHFPPVDPRWYSGQFISYHYLTDLFIASFSNFTRLNVIHSMHCMNLFTSISIFVLLSLLTEKKSTEPLIVFIVIIFVCFCINWVPYSAFSRHITGAQASTFFWSLPVFLTSFYLWNYLNINRFNIPIKYFSVIVFFNMVIVFFAKGTLIFIFIFLELLAFIKNELFSLKKYYKHYKLFFKNITYYLFYPLFSFLIIVLLGKDRDTLVLGVEIRDFEIFGSWNPFYPFIAVYCVTFFVLLIEIRNFKKFRFEYLICSILNFILFFIFKHPGYADLYFLFNAILLNALFIIFSGMESPLKTVFISILTVSLIFFVLKEKKPDIIFNTLEFKVSDVANKSTWGDSIYSKKVIELTEISQKLPDISLIAVPKNSYSHFFCYSAFIGRRIWNENNIYKFNTNSIYTFQLLFKKQEGFIPKYFTDTPKISDYQKAFDLFREEVRLDSTKYEISERRYQLYNKCVFDSLPENSYLDIINKNKWTHILVENLDIKHVNYWIRNLKCIKGNYFTVFTCP
jgi:hypothetical protein